jgi:hypothetical protein
LAALLLFPAQPREMEEARTPLPRGFLAFSKSERLTTIFRFILCSTTSFARIEPSTPASGLFAIDVFNPPAMNLAFGLQLFRSITILTGFSLGPATPLSPSLAPRQQKICKCPVDTFGDICSRALRAKSTGRALFKVRLSANCYAAPDVTAAKTVESWTDLTRSWRKALQMQCVACLQGPSARSAYPTADSCQCLPFVTREAVCSVNGRLFVGGWPRWFLTR